MCYVFGDATLSYSRITIDEPYFPPQYLMFGPQPGQIKDERRRGFIKRNIDDGYFRNDFRRKSLDALSVGTLPN